MTLNLTHSPIEVLTIPETFTLITEVALELIRVSRTPNAWITQSTLEVVTATTLGKVEESHVVIEMLANIPAPVPPSRITHSPAEILFTNVPNVFETQVVIEVLNKIYVPTPSVRTTRVGPRLQSH